MKRSVVNLNIILSKLLKLYNKIRYYMTFCLGIVLYCNINIINILILNQIIFSTFYKTEKIKFDYIENIIWLI